MSTQILKVKIQKILDRLEELENYIIVSNKNHKKEIAEKSEALTKIYKFNVDKWKKKKKRNFQAQT